MTQLASKTSRRRVGWFVAGGVALAIGGAVAVFGSKHTVTPRAALTRTELRGATTFPFSDYGHLLHRFVDAEGLGRVDYRGLRRERVGLDRVLAFVAQAGPSSRPELYPTQNHRKAFFIAAYNASVWRDVIDRAPLSDIGAVRFSFFYRTRYVIDGVEINLKDLEDQRVRAAFHDARVHFALNCASAGCPRLPNEAFVPERLDAQLDREARRFCNDPRNVRVDPAVRRVVLSQIFQWYAEDFVATERSRGRADGDRITFINRYRAEGEQISRGFTVEFIDYDWTINAQHAPGQAPSS
jgi:hypothetical protein